MMRLPAESTSKVEVAEPTVKRLAGDSLPMPRLPSDVAVRIFALKVAPKRLNLLAPVLPGAPLRRQARERETRRLIWVLSLGALGLAWSITTVAAYLPPILERFTSSTALIGFVLACEGIFAIVLPLVIGPMSDATRTPFGRRRPYMVFAIAPMTLALVMVAFMPSFAATAFVLFAFFFAYYIYEPPYRGLYPDVLPDSVFGRAQGVQHVFRGVAIAGALMGGGFLFHLWQPAPFLVAAGVVAVACAVPLRPCSPPPWPVPHSHYWLPGTPMPSVRRAPSASPRKP